MNYIKYDKYIKSILIKDLDLSNKPIWVNIAYESDRKTLLKMGGKGICTNADDMVYHYVDQNEIDLKAIKKGDQIELCNGEVFKILGV